MTNQTIELSLPLLDRPVPLDEVVIRLNQRDQIGLAKVNLHAGSQLVAGDQEKDTLITVRQFIPSGHKIALCNITTHDIIYRYGQKIGIASRSIEAGEHVHSHNLKLPDIQPGGEGGTKQLVGKPATKGASRTFLGYARSNGRVGTRNYIAVISTANCSASVCAKIAHHFTKERLSAFENVDGVIALTHNSGCSIRQNGPEYVWLQRVLAGMAHHPNVGAYLLVGLGCEVNQIADLAQAYGLNSDSVPMFSLSIQDLGGIRRTVQAGIDAVESVLPAVNEARRTPRPLSGLHLALQCGGSDGWSGVTANPLVGLVADEVIGQGGTAVLGETPEIYGAEHLLTQRAVTPAVAEKLLERVQWWEEHTRLFGTEIDNNPTPGNKAGGLTNIVEKALGAVAKGGSTPLTAVYEYAEPVSAPGLTFMDSPGNDPAAVTGQVAGGCNLVLFTTGRGSVFGFKPSPSIKIATNSAMYDHMLDDMDFDAGRVLSGSDMNELADSLLNLVIEVASGEPSKSEVQDIGELEFSPWHYGETV